MNFPTLILTGLGIVVLICGGLSAVMWGIYNIGKGADGSQIFIRVFGGFLAAGIGIFWAMSVMSAGNVIETKPAFVEYADMPNKPTKVKAVSKPEIEEKDGRPDMKKIKQEHKRQNDEFLSSP